MTFPRPSYTRANPPPPRTYSAKRQRYSVNYFSLVCYLMFTWWAIIILLSMIFT